MIALLVAALLAGGGYAGDEPQSPPQGPTPAMAKAKKADIKKDKAPKDPNAPPKGKKGKKAKSSMPAPDEPLGDDEDGDAAVAQPVVVKKPATHFVWKQHPSLRYGRAFRLDFEAKFQEDGRSSYDGAELSAGLATWELHRNRIGVQGTLFKRIDFEIERELTEQELTEKDLAQGVTPRSQWKDVNVDVDYIHNAQIQVGKFKVPFSLDEMTGVTHNDFIYRSLGANYLAPARDVGVMAHGRFFKRGLNYWAGVFRHDGDNAQSKKIIGGDRTFAARLTGTPLRHVSSGRFDGLDIGGSLAVTHVSDDSFRPNGLRGRTIVTQDKIFDPVYVKGTRLRMGGDVDWTTGPASLRAEYMHVLDERRNQGYLDEDLPKARYRAWYVTGTWILTGEKKVRPVKPSAEFLNGGFGSVEAAARIERIWFDSVSALDEPFANPRAVTILGTGVKAVTLGVNWTLNRFMKLQANVIREQPEDPQRSPVAEGAAFWSRVFRLQLVL